MINKNLKIFQSKDNHCYICKPYTVQSHENLSKSLLFLGWKIFLSLHFRCLESLLCLELCLSATCLSVRAHSVCLSVCLSLKVWIILKRKKIVKIVAEFMSIVIFYCVEKIKQIHILFKFPQTLGNHRLKLIFSSILMKSQ